MGAYKGWGSPIRKVKTCESGTCMRCGAKLSVYRKFDELFCAPCTAALPPYHPIAAKKRTAEVPRKA
jgi:ribosomal protein L40E